VQSVQVQGRYGAWESQCRVIQGVVVFGATGKTGELAWQQAVVAGHSVTVFGRSVEKRYASEQITKVQGDVLEPGALYWFALVRPTPKILPHSPRVQLTSKTL